MAGSSAATGADIPEHIHQRIEGLKFLAHHVDEPIVIFNQQMEMVYANPSAEKLTQECPLIPCQATPHIDSSVPAEQTSCRSCYASNIFQVSDHVQNVASSPPPGASAPAFCPLPRAVAIKGEVGMAHFVVLMGARGSESIVTVPQDHASQDFPGQNGETLAESPTHKIIGESSPIQQLIEMIQLVAASEATVLIQGESGTGKELVAQTIHALSRRRSKPFVVVECSSLPETLLESELFGHVRGAFTGAVTDRKGLFEEAEGGTIFLDEIADTTPAFQARLLRVIQEGEIKPVGSNQSIKVNMRVISAGNTPLEELVKTKLFRADLYYRLAVLPLTVPPLRERQEDIPLLVGHFLQQSAQRHGRASMSLSQGAQLALLQHPWPGNVRELENVIERGVVTGLHSILEAEDLFIEYQSTQGNNDLNGIGKAARLEAERSQILQALRDTKGDKTRAARLLKISRSSLYNKLRDCKIS